MNKKIVLKSELSAIPVLARTVTSFGRQNSFSPDTINAINLALEEVVHNIISYGYTDTRKHRISVNFSLKGEELTLEVIDDAQAFNPLKAPSPDIDKPLSDRKIGGLGIYLTVKFMDQVDYRRAGNRNVLTLKKKVNKA